MMRLVNIRSRFDLVDYPPVYGMHQRRSTGRRNAAPTFSGESFLGYNPSEAIVARQEDQGMSLPFDASTKYLLEERLPDWLALTSRQATGPSEIIDADVSTVTAAADKVLRVQGEPSWLLHVELQAHRDPTLPARLHLYNALLEYRHEVPVWSVAVVLRRGAELPDLTGVFERRFAAEEPYRWFRYEVVRIWQRPVSTFLQGPLGIVPLAPLSDVNEADLPNVIKQMNARIQQEARPGEAGSLWTAVGILMGLRYHAELIELLLEGVHGMTDSTFFQHIVAKGRLEEARRMVLRIGGERFGPPPQRAETTINALTNLEKIEDLGVRLLHVASWDELLAVP
jgi:hypothetical protein